MMGEKQGNAVKRMRVSDFDLGLTLDSGQVFGWRNENGWRVGEIYGKPARIRQDGNTIEYLSTGDGLTKSDIVAYFSLDLPAKKVYKRITNDPHLRRAVREFYGLRLIRQDPWYCIISFVCSSISNIPRIEQNINSIRREHGEKIGNESFLFPTIEELRAASQKGLRACGLGFRDKYVHQIANTISERQIEQIRHMDYGAAKRELMKFPGIGEKIADCVLLFSFNRGQAFPIDIWISRIMHELYGKDMERRFKTSKNRFSYSQMQEFAREKWGDYAGYAQQFLYMYARKHKKEIRKIR